jgi:hypothetical protein
MKDRKPISYLKENQAKLAEQFDQVITKSKYPTYNKLEESLIEKLKFLKQNIRNKGKTNTSIKALLNGTTQEERNFIRKLLVDTIEGDDTYHYALLELKRSDYEEDRLLTRVSAGNEHLMEIKLGLAERSILKDKIQFCLEMERKYAKLALQFDQAYPNFAGGNEFARYSELCKKEREILKEELLLEKENIGDPGETGSFIHKHVVYDIIKLLKKKINSESEKYRLEELLLTGKNESNTRIDLDCNRLQLAGCFKPLFDLKLISGFSKNKKDRERLAKWIADNFMNSKSRQEEYDWITFDDYLKKKRTDSYKKRLMDIEVTTLSDGVKYYSVEPYSY